MIGERERITHACPRWKPCDQRQKPLAAATGMTRSITNRGCSGASQHCRTPTLPRPGTQRSLLYMDANLANRITVDPGKRSGKPCIRGLRITVSDVLEYLASGMTESQILADFPELTIEDIRACLAFAAERERRLLGSVA